MAILKKLVLVLIILGIFLAGLAMILPRKVHVERSTVIQAPRATVFALVNGYRMFNRWSPWAEADPTARYTFAGPDFGVGAKMSWTGDPKKVGSGSQEIIESRPPDIIRTSLDFGGQGTGVAQFTLTPEGEATKVTWGFDTDLGMNPVSRYFGLMFDSMIGPDYEKGLAGLKTLAESLPKVDFSNLAVERVDVPPITVAYVAASSSKDALAIGKAIGDAYAEVGRFMTVNHLKQAGPPITINTKWDDTGYMFDAAIPVDRAPEKPVSGTSPVKVKATYAGKALKVVHKGAYTEMPPTYDKLFAFAAAHGYEQAAPPWDEYVSDPGTTPEPELITHIFLPVK